MDSVSVFPVTYKNEPEWITAHAPSACDVRTQELLLITTKEIADQTSNMNEWRLAVSIFRPIFTRAGVSKHMYASHKAMLATGLPTDQGLDYFRWHFQTGLIITTPLLNARRLLEDA
jgi:hypothetical protein